MLTLGKYSENLFVKILSISVAEWLYTLVSVSVIGTRHRSVDNQEIVGHNYKFSCSTTTIDSFFKIV